MRDEKLTVTYDVSFHPSPFKRTPLRQCDERAYTNATIVTRPLSEKSYQLPATVPLFYTKMTAPGYVGDIFLG